MAIRSSRTQVAFNLNRDFWKYWTGQTISNLGSSITIFALPLLVYQLTGSAVNLGIATAINFVPNLLFGLLIGAWTDRINRKSMMLLTDVGRAVVIATIPLMASAGLLTVWWIYLVEFLHATLRIFFESGQFAAIPSLVNQDDLVSANGRIQASYSAASVLGPLLAGLLIGVMPVSQFLYFDAGSFLISSLSLALIRTSFNAKEHERRSGTAIGRDVIEGLRYVLGHPVLRNISIMMALMNFVGSPVYSQLVLFAKEQFQASNSQVSFLYSATSVGIVVFSLAAGPLRKRWPFSKVALGALMILGLFTLALAFTPWYWLGIALLAGIGGVGMLFNINTGSLRQAIVPNHMLGRVMSIASVLATIAVPFGALLGGFAVQWTGSISLIYATVGVLMMLIPLIFSFTPLGHAERYLPQKEVGEQASVS